MAMVTTQQPAPVETNPKAAEASSSLVAPPSNRQRLAERVALLDTALAALVVVFAFLSASFPARNSDFLLHAASGRLLAQGGYVFGEDPFCFTTQGVYWTNHAWLSDLLFYALYAIPEIGGIAVVAFKAIVIAILALVLLQAARRQRESLWIPSACVALAVLALSPRLLLQSACWSFLFLALTLWLLQRPARPASSAFARWRSLWLLPPLFALWVNLDDWFLLGPATVALYLLGEALHLRPLSPPAENKAPAPGKLRALVLVLLVGLAVCPINPHHVHAFTLPWELGSTPAGEALMQDNEFRYLLGSPFQELMMLGATGPNIAALAYVPLLLVGMVSFAMSWGMWRWWRLLIWLAFLALSLTSYRAVPFFAIVAGPIASLNFLDFAARRFGTSAFAARLGGRWSLGGRAATLLAGVLLVSAVIPGWLQSAAARRHVGWGVPLDPSLQQAALQIRDWRERGAIAADARLFNTLPDAACYLAWFCPGERSFMDLRLSLFPEAAHDFVTVRESLIRGEDGAGDAPSAILPGRAWRAVFHKWNISYLLFNTRDPRLPASRMVEQRLLLNPDDWPDEWTVCYLDGRTMIAGWKDHKRKLTSDPYGDIRLNVDRVAFGSKASLTPLQSTSALSASALQADEAFLHYLHYQLMGPRWVNQNRQEWEAALAAALSGCAASPGGPLLNASLLLARIDFTYRILHGLPIAAPGTPPRSIDRFAEQLLSTHLAAGDAGPPASLYLAVRAARGALSGNPNDARTQLLLGEVYLRLAWKTRERACGRSLPQIALIRQTQAAAALETAVRLNPNLERAHELLSELYENAVLAPIPQPGIPWNEQLLHRPNLESALKHRREQVRCARDNGPRLSDTAKSFSERIERMDEDVQQLTALLHKTSDEWELAGVDKPLLARVQLALERGLTETALNLLLQPDVNESLAGAQRAVAAAWSIELLLALGRLDEARAFLVPDNPHSLGMLPPPLSLPAYDWFAIQLAAGDGNYEECEQRLAALRAAPKARGITASSLLAQTIGHQLLWDAPLAAGMPWQVARTAPVLLGLPPNRNVMLVRGLEQSLLLLQQETDVQALRGWLALEAGDLSSARRCLSEVLKCCREGKDQPSGGERTAGFALPLRAAPLAVLYGDWLQANE
jgi:hypothetical protein